VSATPVPSRPEARAAEALAAIEAVVPELAGSALLDLRDGLVRAEGAVLRRALTPTSQPVPTRPEPEGDPVLTLNEAAAYLRRGQSWLYHRWKALRLGFRSGRRLLFRRSALDRYLAACERRSR
jgi:hypothetical protein